MANTNSVKIGVSAEFGHLTSTSAEAIRFGILTAIDEINENGGVLEGRPLELVSRDNRSIPARGVADLEHFAQDDDLVAVFGGKFSPVMLDMVDKAHELKIPLLDPWAAADRIIQNGYSPNYAFRLSLKDSWAIPAMIDFAVQNEREKLGFLFPNNGWGRSSAKAVERYLKNKPRVTLVGTTWYNWGDAHLANKYGALVSQGAEAIIMVANETEGNAFIKAAFQYDPLHRVPLISHWGITGGDFVKMTDGMLREVDLSVVQTFTFVGKNDEKTKSVLARTKKLFGIQGYNEILSPVGFAHAYDLTHILARAINLAQSTDRHEIRTAMEEVKDYAGLVKFFSRPFSNNSHEALTRDDVFLGRFNEDGTITPINK